ncbi:MAG: DUF3800 domain-containing protein [Deltaproteobacteria bacterium]|nr:DUF3800 domain-containing protein [Deltaproteobacteria bacterium]
MNGPQHPEMWIYIDESGDPNAEVKVGDSQHFHVGMLSVIAPITREPIDRALGELLRDEDSKGNTEDQSCLERKYFHASKDSKNAHSAICREVAKLRPAEFEFFSFDKAVSKPDDSMLDSSSEFHRRMVELVVAKVTGNRILRVNLSIAERSTFPPGISDLWTEQFVLKVTCSAADMPQIPCCFPKLDVTIVPGSDPGVQMADFLLWAALRQYGPASIRGDEWAKRAGLHFDTCFQEDNGSLGGHEFHINEPIPAFHELAVPGEYVKAPKEKPTINELANYLAWSEANIQHLAKNGVPEHASHMLPEIQSLSANLRDEHLSIDTIHKMTGLSIRLIDTVPLYDPKNRDEVNFATDAKKMLGVVFLRHEIRWMSIAHWWRGIRVSIARTNPVKLGWT